MDTLAAFTATHPTLSQALLWWLIVMVAVLITWALCKERTVYDEASIPAAPGLASERRKVS